MANAGYRNTVVQSAGGEQDLELRILALWPGEIQNRHRWLDGQVCPVSPQRGSRKVSQGYRIDYQHALQTIGPARSACPTGLWPRTSTFLVERLGEQFR